MMSSSFVFGQFLPGHTWLHRLDARSKLFSLLLMIIFSLFSSSWLSLLLQLVIILFVVKSAKLSILSLIRSIRFFIVMIALSSLLQVFLITGGHVYWHWGIIQLTQAGCQISIVFLLRFLIAIVSMTLFLLTSSPIAISDTVSFLLFPLKIFKLPLSDIVLTLSIALRFVPTMIAELNNIIDAQKSRGAVFNQGSFIHRLKMYLPVMLPLFLNSVKRAEDLAAAMIMRGYTDGRRRTQFRLMHWRTADSLLMLAWIPIGLLIRYVNQIVF